MRTRSLFLSMLAVLTIVGSSPADHPDELRKRAERWFSGVYGGDASIVDELASEKIVISYPIFDKLFNSPVIRGRDAVKTFVIHFGRKWTDQKVTIDEALVDGNKVVLLWSFQARAVNAEHSDQTPSQPHHWGGITFIRFDEFGDIVQELGEESDPGPFGRMRTSTTRATKKR